jgi:hypothetical protein
MILAADAVGRKHHSAYHRLFAAAQWSLDELGLAVLGLILPLLALDTIVLIGDDTLARKRGLKVHGTGMHHDPLLSSRKKAIVNWGHCWVLLGVRLKFPFADRYFCLPILFRLYVSQQTIQKKGGSYKTKPQLLVQMLDLVCQRHADRHFHLLVDSAYGGKSVLLKLPANCDLTSRLKLDARLYDAAGPKTGKAGRPRKRGTRLPTPQQMLQGRCRHIELDIYGRHDKSRIAECVARVYAAPDRPLKVVAVEPLSGGREIQAFYSTVHTATAEWVLSGYASRYSIEDTIREAKGQLGFEQPQGWTKWAVQRTAPVAMLLYSLIVLWFNAEGHRHYQAPNRPWYAHKPHASFADMLATLRACSVEKEVLSMPLHEQSIQNLLQTLIHVVKQAA